MRRFVRSDQIRLLGQCHRANLVANGNPSRPPRETAQRHGPERSVPDPDRLRKIAQNSGKASCRAWAGPSVIPWWRFRERVTRVPRRREISAIPARPREPRPKVMHGVRAGCVLPGRMAGLSGRSAFLSRMSAGPHRASHRTPPRSGRAGPRDRQRSIMRGAVPDPSAAHVWIPEASIISRRLAAHAESLQGMRSRTAFEQRRRSLTRCRNPTGHTRSAQAQPRLEDAATVCLVPVADDAGPGLRVTALPLDREKAASYGKAMSIVSGMTPP